MTKVAKSKNEKVANYIGRYPDEFCKNFDGSLKCKLCNCLVNFDKAFNVESHRKTNSHASRLRSASSQATLSPVTTDFSYQVCDAFLKADIPLKKLRSPSLKVLFNKMGHEIPSETTCRRRVDEIASQTVKKIKSKIAKSKIFLIADESDIDGKKFMNIMIGSLNRPEEVFLADCILLPKSSDSNTVASLLDDFLKNFGILKENFALLISDAAPYMVSAARGLKIFYPQAFHITCTAHLLHNCSMKIQSAFNDVNTLIAAVKMSIQKNHTRRQKFNDVRLPPEVVVTRWGTWLNAAIYYSQNLPEIRRIVNEFEDDGKIVKNAKNAVNQESLPQSLLKITSQYKPILEAINTCESNTFSIKKAFDVLCNLNFGNDDCEIKNYIDRRMAKSQIPEIIQMQNASISPETYSLLFNCPGTSCAV